MKREMLYSPIRLLARRAEQLQRLVLRRGGEREVAGVGQHPARFNDAVYRVFVVLRLAVIVAIARPLRAAQRLRHSRRRLPALPGVRLVYHNGEVVVPQIRAADGVLYEWELLHGGCDDFHALGEVAAQIGGGFGILQRGSNLRELPYGLADLSVKQRAIGNHDDGAKRGLAIALQIHKIQRKPRDSVGFAAARGVLN